MPFTKREMNIPLLLAQLTTAFALGLFFAALGPFGTYADLTVGMRYAYWVGLVLVGYLNIMVAAHAIAALAPRLATGWSLSLITLVSALPTTFVVAWVESVVRLTHTVPLSVVPRVYGSVAVIQLAMLLVLTRFRPPVPSLLLVREKAAPVMPLAAPPEPEIDPTAPAVTGFHRRIPAHLGNELLALGAEDHYLRVVTTRGSDLILMRLSDALNELGPDAGLQVHRSWWVAQGAVGQVQRQGARTVLVLRNGLFVPVSRTYLAAVRSAGWPMSLADSPAFNAPGP